MIQADEIQTPDLPRSAARYMALELELYVTQILLTDLVNILRRADQGLPVDDAMAVIRDLKWSAAPLPENVVQLDRAADRESRCLEAVSRRLDELRDRLFAPIEEGVHVGLLPPESD